MVLMTSFSKKTYDVQTPTLKDHSIMFYILKEDSNTKFTQSQVAKLLLPATAWNCKAAKVSWHLKWSLNGLQPQRAVVMMTQDTTIPAGKAFMLQ